MNISNIYILILVIASVVVGGLSLVRGNSAYGSRLSNRMTPYESSRYGGSRMSMRADSPYESGRSSNGLGRNLYESGRSSNGLGRNLYDSSRSSNNPYGLGRSLYGMDEISRSGSSNPMRRSSYSLNNGLRD